jgi:C4-type Zn-finger protein
MTVTSATCPECGVTVEVVASLEPIPHGYQFRMDVRSPFLEKCVMAKDAEVQENFVCPHLSAAAAQAIDRAQKPNG